ncbi:MAG: L-serine ammonia-lyase, iron-sulfur-dependent, subunit alpha, partial [Cetobacterium sp.]|uniref:L-serine ammonia-lyase, iron-sulfur-dependent, subunit alpha n=1 Tax=Cetobacterium sp. TaxID=2071632 RepID=UPI002FC85826
DVDSAQYAMYRDGKQIIRFDQVVYTLKETGVDLKEEYKETSLGGLAKYQFDGTC